MAIFLPGPLLPMVECQARPDSAGGYEFTSQKAIGVALQANHEILMAREMVNAWRGDRMSKGGYFLPQLVLQGEIGQNPERSSSQSISESRARGQLYRRFDAYLKQRLIDGGTSRALHRQSKHFLKAAEADLRSVENAVAAKVKRIFAKTAEISNKLQEQERQLRRMRELTEMVSAKVVGGAASERLLYRARSTTEIARKELVGLRSDLQLQKIELVKVLGLTELDPKHIRFIGGPDVNTSVDPDKVLANAMGNRADLQALEHTVNAEREGVRALMGDRLPKVDLVAGYSIDRTEDRRERSNEDFTVGVHGKWTVFDRNRIRGQVAKQKALQRKAALAYDQAVLEARGTVHGAFHRLEKAEELVITSRALSRYAGNGYAITRIAFQEGEAQTEDMIRASREMLAAGLVRIESEREMELALIELEESQGMSSFQDQK